MEHPFWMLAPWAVFAVAAGVRFWQLTSLFRRHLLDTPTPTEQFRRMLERIWAKQT